MIIRPIEQSDIPDIIHLGGRMHEESQYSTLAYSPERVAAKCYQVLISMGLPVENTPYKPLKMPIGNGTERETSSFYELMYPKTTGKSIAFVAYSDGSIVGMMAGQVHQYEYGDDLIATDILVYVAPQHRGSQAFIKMVRQYVSWAKKQGAKLIFLAQTTGINVEHVSNLYQRLGFKPVGGQFCMEVA